MENISSNRIEETEYSPLIENLRKLLRPSKDYERCPIWRKTLNEITKHCGITPGAVRNWFTYYRNPYFQNVAKVAAYMKINPYDLYVDRRRWINIEGLSKEKQDIIKRIIKLAEDDRFFNTIKNDVYKKITEDGDII